MKILLFANTAWYLFNFRQSLAHAIRDAGHDVLLLSPPDAYGQRLQDLGFDWRAAPMDRRSLNPWREAVLLLWLRRLMATEQIDLVHGFTIKCAVYGSLAARTAGVRARVNAVPGMGYVFTSTDLKARSLRPLVRGLMRLALDGSAARLILQNPDDMDWFERNRLVARERLRLIPGSGVNCERFAPRSGSRLPAPGERFSVLLPARLLWDKGIGEYVAAARVLRTRGHPIDFLLAGDPDPGNPAAIPVPTVRSWVDEGVVQWLGHVEDMAALFRSVHAVVLPSYREGLPKGLAEAAACGLPLVTTDVPGCRLVVTDEEDGLLVPVGDSAALANAIERLYRSPSLCERFGGAARRKALREFDERKIIERTLDVYREVLPAARMRAGSEC